MHRQYQLVTGCLHQMSSLFVGSKTKTGTISLQKHDDYFCKNLNLQTHRLRLRLTAGAPVKLMVSVDSVTFQFTTCIHCFFTMCFSCPLSSDHLHVTSSKPRMCQKLKYSCGGLHQNNSWFSYKIMSLILFIKVYRYYIGFKFPPFLGHWRTFKEWSWFSPFLCPYCHCPDGRWTFAPVGGPDCSGAGYQQACTVHVHLSFDHY